jgi:hypothetical protein
MSLRSTISDIKKEKSKKTQSEIITQWVLVGLACFIGVIAICAGIYLLYRNRKSFAQKPSASAAGHTSRRSFATETRGSTAGIRRASSSSSRSWSSRASAVRHRKLQHVKPDKDFSESIKEARKSPVKNLYPGEFSESKSSDKVAAELYPDL